MKFQAVKGMRDFYPDDMRIRNWIVDTWRSVSIRHGFEEYDGPILEHLDLYTVKSGESIVGELFHLEDRGGRKLAIRPELTPTLARMINARAQSLPRPIKWYSLPRLCRAERPQRGRLREFFQWNVDIVGEDALIADAECIFVAIDFFRAIGLTADDFVMRINSRGLMAVLLQAIGVPADRLEEAYVQLDRGEKVGPEKFRALWDASFGEAAPYDRLEDLLAVRRVEQITEAAGRWGGQAVSDQVERLAELFTLLQRFGVGDYCQFNTHVIRGLAYYTGPVFEAFGKGSFQRAICGGGRYDHLLGALGGPAMSGVGFGTSDVVIQEVLADLGRLPKSEPAIEVFVVDAAERCFDHVLEVTARLRGQGIPADFSYRRQSVGKQLRAAGQRNARWVVLLGEETLKHGQVTLKNMAGGDQREVPLAALLASPRDYLTDLPTAAP